MQQIDDLKTAFTAFQADFSKFVTDVQAKLAALAANQVNPADAQALTDISTGLGAVDAQVKSLDSSLNS